MLLCLAECCPLLLQCAYYGLLLVVCFGLLIFATLGFLLQSIQWPPTHGLRREYCGNMVDGNLDELFLQPG